MSTYCNNHLAISRSLCHLGKQSSAWRVTKNLKSKRERDENIRVERPSTRGRGYRERNSLDDHRSLRATAWIERRDTHTWCARTRNDSLGFVPHVGCIDSILLRDTYAGITRRDLNPRRCPLRNSARTARVIFPLLIVPRLFGIVVVVVCS